MGQWSFAFRWTEGLTGGSMGVVGGSLALRWMCGSTVGGRSNLGVRQAKTAP